MSKSNKKIQSLSEVTTSIPSKTDYMNSKPKNEVYYFGIKPQIPGSLSDYLKSNNKKK